MFGSLSFTDASSSQHFEGVTKQPCRTTSRRLSNRLQETAQNMISTRKIAERAEDGEGGDSVGIGSAEDEAASAEINRTSGERWGVLLTGRAVRSFQ